MQTKFIAFINKWKQNVVKELTKNYCFQQLSNKTIFFVYSLTVISYQKLNKLKKSFCLCESCTYKSQKILSKISSLSLKLINH